MKKRFIDLKVGDYLVVLFKDKLFIERIDETTTYSDPIWFRTSFYKYKINRSDAMTQARIRVSPNITIFPNMVKFLQFLIKNPHKYKWEECYIFDSQTRKYDSYRCAQVLAMHKKDTKFLTEKFCL